ncbi:hypothetical protein UO65_0047 [Actinokineospora spheciospongiae]|uniref:Fe2OG dioxygenase domain-containing protein n=1 Tax=Actinokineospora spheciospongiae TaxID=909613 RepID=W7IU35_9PSEU|nr:2OG-Fe(II) oxygenase family protein [Actinokineospora spheciospongiae]EWC64440.1 hypothetical protein UO65_0047 [Actinokineospora spheciospongiae]PWW60235.1 2-oxoglutarate-Fe(II)-dependent oxygenase superfamily protein [Actinokineospora spheciospongiae]
MVEQRAPEPVVLERAAVRGGGIVFAESDGLGRALDAGLFALAVPEGLDLRPGVRLCREFHRPRTGADAATRPYRGMRELEGVYFDREHFQTEHLLADAEARARHFPPEVVAMADRMNELALLVLRTALDAVGVTARLWSQVTSGAVDGFGTHWFAANHYRSDRDQLGCAPHKDTGFVTLLYNEQDGLEAFSGGRWSPVPPVSGHFIVNFGGSFELLTEDLARSVHAVLHRVRRCAPASSDDERFSFAAFVNPSPAALLHKVDDGGGHRVVSTVADFLRDFNRDTWNDRHDDFGIATTRGGGTA